MIDSAEEALDSIEERDYVLSLQRQNDPDVDATIADQSGTDMPQVQFNPHLQVPVLRSAASSTRSSLSVHFIE